MLQWWQSRESGIFIMNLKTDFLRQKKTLIIIIVAFVIAAVYPIVRVIKAQSIDSSSYDLSQPEELAMTQGNSLLAVSDHSLLVAEKSATLAKATSKAYTLSSISSSQEIKMVITGYSSTPEQTDSTPFITASEQYVEDGIAANNILPFGTKIKIPELYGDKIFEVQDRMHSRKASNRLDIWFPSYQEAVNFGVKTAYIEIVE